MKIPCPNCPIVTNSQRSFFRHFGTHQKEAGQPVPTTDNTPAPNLPAYMCTDCKATFSSMDKFLQHVRNDQKADKVSCPCCNRTKFPSYDSIRKHVTRFHSIAEKGDKDRSNNPHLNSKIDEGISNVTVESEVQDGSDVAITDCLPSVDQLVSTDDVETVTKKLASDISVELQTIQNHHGIAQVAMDSVIEVFAKAMTVSKTFHENWIQKHLSPELVTLDKEMDPLSALLSQSRISTWSKRHTICQRELIFVDQLEVFIGCDEMNERRSVAYSPPRQLLARFFSDPTVQASFNAHQETLTDSTLSQKYQYTNIFHSPYYKVYIRGTLSEEERRTNAHPILLGLYRYKLQHVSKQKCKNSMGSSQSLSYDLSLLVQNS